MTTENLLELNEDNIQFDESKDYLSELVGEGKKFKDVQDLAKGKAYADSYIDNLLRQRDEIRDDYLKMREENTSRAKLEELIDQLKQQQQLASREPPKSNEETPKLNPDEVKSLMASTYQQLKETERQESNFTEVRKKLTERFGDNYAKALKDQANSLGLSDQEVNNMARTNPNLFYKTFDLSSPPNTENFQTPPRNEKRTDNFAPKAGEKRTWKWYLDQKAKGKVDFLDPKTSVQIEKDAQEMGVDFYT